MTITTRHYMRVDFDYPQDTWCSAWDNWVDVIESAIFDFKREHPCIDELSIFTGNACCKPYVEAKSPSLHGAYAFQYLLLQLLEAYGCTVEGEEHA